MTDASQTDYLPNKEYRLTLHGGAGEIEALLNMPVQSTDVTRAALICHPHPLYGGALDNKVTYTLARSLNRLGMPALRFNFRGVGTTAGEHDEGRGETADVIELLAWLKATWPQAELWLAGFSFGGMVAMRAATQADIAQLITVAPATRYLPDDSTAPSCPWLLLHGEADDVVDLDETRTWLRNHNAKPVIETFPETGHFFHGQLTTMRDRILEHYGPL